MKINNFYPLTPEVSKKLLEAKLTAAEWRTWIYLVGIDPWGDIYKDIDTLTVMTDCDVSKATFYRAIAKFQELELFDIQDKGISIRNLKGVSSLKNETTVSEMRQDSQNCETRRKNETKKSKMRQDSQNCENQPPEPSPSKTSEVPQTIQTYSDFIKTLSEEERANFLNFCQSKTKNLSQEVNDIEAWLAHTNKAGKNRWEVYYQKYLAAKQTQAKKTEKKSALDEFRRELEEIERQAQKAWSESQNQNRTDCGGET